MEMFNKIFGNESEGKGKETNSSTSGTDELEGIQSPKKQYEDFLVMSNKLESELVFRISERKEDYRSYLGYEDGGIICDDEKQVDKLRSVGKEMIKQIGRKILSGSFNLTKISFPIRACYPKTALYNSISCLTIFPYFMSAAAIEKNPLERFKITLACFMGCPYYLNMFLKPLNPILGQTLQATLIDGTQIYAEQISHHPPISYFLVIGPKQCYRFSGYYDFDISPGLNSLTLKNKGKRKVEFQDGGVIQGTYAANEFSATFIGQTRIEEVGSCEFEDKKNDLSVKIEFDKVKKKPSDYFRSEIMHKGKRICEMYGTYLGYVQFDKIRYWDGRDIQPLHIELKKKISLLPSDWSYREDIIQFIKDTENLNPAQQWKQNLEEIQRNDAKLRKKYWEIQQSLKEEEREKEKERLKQKQKEEKEKLKRDKKQKKEKR